MVMDKAGAGTQQSVSNDDEVQEDLNETNPERNSSHYMAILIESLSILGKIQETLEVYTSFFLRHYVVRSIVFVW